MINLKKSLRALGLMGVSMIVACSSQDDIINDIPQDDALKHHTCKLELNVTKSGFSDEPQGRSVSDWVNGDQIFLTFDVENGMTYGDAIYNNGAWILNYYGSLTQNTTAKCSAVYFDNSDFESGSVVHLTENTAIYEDSVGSYIYNGGTLSVIANLKPKTGRIRFAGNDKDKITLYGITHFTSYDYSTGRFTNSITAMKTAVSSDYTPYIYGTFSDADQPRINIITETDGYTRLVSLPIFKPGESGFMTIPTDASHNGWLNSVILKINGVELKMIPVPNSNGFCRFLLAKTETTQQLYYAVMNNKVSTSLLPKSGLSWKEWETFISTISLITGLKFRMPTLDEWQYAARVNSTPYPQPNKRDYTYSGSNNIEIVGWYYENSNKSVHEVGEKIPNWLGFYDMSGNLQEVTSTIQSASNYYSDYYWCGGSYADGESLCTITSTRFYSEAYAVSTGGLRLALSNN